MCAESHEFIITEVYERVQEEVDVDNVTDNEIMSQNAQAKSLNIYSQFPRFSKPKAAKRARREPNRNRLIRKAGLKILSSQFH